MNCGSMLFINDYFISLYNMNIADVIHGLICTGLLVLCDRIVLYYLFFS